MQWLRRFIARNPAKVFREGSEPITMGVRNMKRKVKIFSDCDTDNGLDENINKWIEENGVELLDVRVTFDQNKVYGFMQATATVIYADRTEG
jgi:hypothetical protein|nr:MAG TPA: Sporulation protein Cse60 [Caudoviricetes sp.]